MRKGKLVTNGQFEFEPLILNLNIVLFQEFHLLKKENDILKSMTSKGNYLSIEKVGQFLFPLKWSKSFRSSFSDFVNYPSLVPSKELLALY